MTPKDALRAFLLVLQYDEAKELTDHLGDEGSRKLALAIQKYKELVINERQFYESGITYRGM